MSLSELNPYEMLAVALGLANIVLLVRRSIWNFPVGIAMVTLYAAIFFERKLYGEAGLQVFFAGVQIYGWWLWARAGGVDSQVAVRWLGWSARLGWAILVALATLALGTVMHRMTDAALPYPDAFITSASIAAQFLLSFRRLETWALWIVVDLVSIPLYIMRDLPLTAGLYVIFLGLSIMGLREWVKVASPAGSERGAAA